MRPEHPTDRGDVLVVEDEPLLQHLLRQALTRVGYRVTVAGNASEALAELASRGPVFRVAYVDLSLPDVSGAVVIAHIRAAHPSLPVVLSSGLDLHAIPAPVRADAAALLLKPYDFDQLFDAFARVAAEPSAARCA